MAETIKIEIPVSVQDKTDPSLSNITRKLNSMAQASQKVSKMMMGSAGKKTGLEKSIEKLSQNLNKTHQIEIKAQDNATPVMSDVESHASRISGASADVTLGAEDNASGVMSDAEDRLAGFDGNSATASVDADGNAVEEIGNAEDALAAFDGSVGTASVDADGNAIEEIGNAEDALAGYDGSTGTAEIEADDQASDIISSIGDLVASIDGLTAVVSIEAQDNTGGLIPQTQSGSSYGNGFNVPSAASGYAAAKSGLATAAGFAGLSFGIGSAINSFMDFEAGMSEVKAISGATEEQFESLTAKAKYMGSTTKFTATESAEAFKYMAMAGWKPEQMEAGIEGIMNLAAASGESLGTTSDIVTDAMTAFGLSAEGFTKNGVSNVTHFADVLAQAASNSNTNVGIMGESFKYAAPMMGAMGYSAEDTAVALGIMANAGIKGSMAGTTLRKAISNLSAPTKAMKAAMDKYGISLRDDTGQMRTLKGVMDNVRESLSGLSEDEQAAAVKTIFGQTAMSGMMAIINAEADAYDDLTDKIYHADGASERMKNTMLDNLSGDMTLLSSAWEGVQDTFGERAAPHLRSLVQAITDAMPGLSDAINAAFDNIDPLIDGFKTKVGNMLSSEEWKDADGKSKINIAWDTLIGDPFTEWIQGDGATTITDGIAGLFEDALKILPGGEEAGLTSWLSAGVIAIGASKIASIASAIGDLSAKVSSLGAAGTAIGTFGSTIGPAIPWIAGVAAALVALNIAMDAYNNKKIENSISDHFGDIKLTQDQINALSDVILDIDWTANITVGLESVKEAETLRSDTEAKLKENKAIEYEAKVGVKLTKDDEEAYVANCEAFVEGVKKQITKSAEGLTMIVDSMKIETPEGGSLSDLIDDFAAEDIAELSSLEEAYKTAVEDALSKGLQDVDANKAVSELQAKIQEIQDRWSNAREKAAQQMINDEFLGRSGAELEGGTFKRLIEQNQANRQLKREEMAAGREALYTHLYANEDRYSALGYDINDFIDQYKAAEKYTNTAALANDLFFQARTLMDAYSEEITGWSDNGYSDNEARKGFTDSLKSWVKRDDEGNINMSLEGKERSGDLLRQNMDRYYNTSADVGLQELYNTYMEPDVQELQGIIDEYAAIGSEAPKELLNRYNAAMEVAAAAGSESAGMQMFANSLVKNGEQDLIDAIQSGQMGDDNLRAALTRALLTPSEDMELEMDDFKAKLGAIDLDEASAEEAASDVLEKTAALIDSLSESGGGYEITESGVEISFEDVQVASEALGQSVDEFCANYGIDVGELEAGATVTISADQVDMSMMESALSDEEMDLGETNATGTANVDMENGTTDTSGVEEGVQEDLDGMEDWETDGEADVELSQTNNVDAIYNEVDGDITSKFASGFTATAPVAITLSYSITNPTANISLSGSASGSGTVNATVSANGRFVDGPLLSWVGEDGPEYIIPVGHERRDRGIELWQQAGEALGIPGFADGGIVGGAIPVYSSGGDSEEGSDYVNNEGISPEISNGNNGGVTVQINLSPEFNLNDADENNVLAMIRAHMKELADDFGYEISEMLNEAYENRPVA